MNTQLAAHLLLAFSIFLGLLCLSGLIMPNRLIAFVSGFWEKPYSMAFAVGTRILLGALLVLAAPVSSYPTAFTFLGYVAIAAAVIILIAGKGTISRVILWVKYWPLIRVRAWLLLAVAFFAFLVSGLVG